MRLSGPRLPMVLVAFLLGVAVLPVRAAGPVASVADSREHRFLSVERTTTGFSVSMGGRRTEVRFEERMVWALDELGRPRWGARREPGGFDITDRVGDALETVRLEGGNWICRTPDGTVTGRVILSGATADLLDGQGKRLGTVRREGDHVVIREPSGKVRCLVRGLGLVGASSWYLHRTDPLEECAVLGALLRWPPEARSH